MNVETREKLYEGKAKIVYETNRPGVIVQYFKDDATAFNALKKGTIVGKGVVNNRMSAALFERLGSAGIPTHYLATLSDREMLCHRLDIIKIETIVRNIVAGQPRQAHGSRGGHADQAADRRALLQVRSPRRPDAQRGSRTDAEARFAHGGRVDEAHGAQDQHGPAPAPGAPRAPAGRFQARVRAPRPEAFPRRRDLPGHVPALGQSEQGEARQGPVPPRPGRRRGSVPGGLPPARHGATHEKRASSCGSSPASWTCRARR